MPRFDNEKMVKLVSELRRSVNRLKELSKSQKDRFLRDPDKIGSAKYHFIVAIEACIDMANHIISQNGLRAPEDYADTFGVMGEVGAVEEDFALKLKTMAKFRNRLFHIYWEVDDSKVYDILQSSLEDFKRFLDSLAKYLDWANKTEER
jgi:uncharacterized protein YutE (UPF0331/DUF86 family)